MMGWSKVSYYLWVIGAILLLPLIVILLVNVLFLGLLFLALLGLIGWLQYRVMHENRYIVFQDEVAVRMVGYKTRCYRIDMIKVSIMLTSEQIGLAEHLPTGGISWQYILKEAI